MKESAAHYFCCIILSFWEIASHFNSDKKGVQKH